MTMLIMGRKEGEKVQIGDNITLMVVRITPTQVRFGIEAPKDIPVHREEIYHLIQRANQSKQSSLEQPNPAELMNELES
jgi:carbon storage regulator